MKTPEHYRKVFYSNTGRKEVAITVDIYNGEIVVTCSAPHRTVSVTLSDSDAHEMAAHLTALTNEPLKD